MGRSQETSNKKEVKKKQEKKKKDKEQKRTKRKLEGKKASFDDMIAYVDKFGVISSTPPDGKDMQNSIAAEDIQLSYRSTNHKSPADRTKKGVVSFFNEKKGFGFIRESESGTSYFFHIKNLIDEVSQSSRVSFETGRGPKGVTALNVKLSEE